ncbi:MAG: CHAT domain-containing protein [Agriterribacter sp.]
MSFLNKIVTIEDDKTLSVAEKLYECQKLKEQFELSKLAPDSVYARLLHRMGALYVQMNNMVPTQTAIDFTQKAIQINISGASNCSPYFAVNSYSNLAIFYKSAKLYKKAYSYYDSAIIINDSRNLNNPMAENCYIGKVLASLKLGDYQKCIEDCTQGILVATKLTRLDILIALFNQRAQSYLYLKKNDQVLADVDSARKYALITKSNYELATEEKTRALLYAELKQYEQAIKSFTLALQYRKVDGDCSEIAADYTELGNFYLQRKDYVRAINSYNNTLLFAGKSNDIEKLSKGYTNLAQVFFLRAQPGDYIRSEEYHKKALEVFNIYEPSILENVSLQKLNVIGNTDLLLVILDNKTELLLHLYKINKNEKYLDACISTGMLMDSAITFARHEQTSEKSKLYWRSDKRNFFVNILDACYQAGDTSRFFFFMEKSRAVLLNDRLNETVASVSLPEAESSREQELKFKLEQARMQMNNTDIHSVDYNKHQFYFLQVKDEFERYIRILEQKYPEYYRYKYDNDVATMQSLRERLFQTKETFVHYFVEDSILYILSVNAWSAKMVKYNQHQFCDKDLKLLLALCSDKSKLNSQYAVFAALSNKLYHVLFADLNIVPGRVIISLDNFLIPFEVLSRDKEGKKLLLYDYSFSYVYSASFLLKQTINQSAHADFVGFAPVTFKADLKLPDLKNAAIALQKSAAHYKNMKLFENANASRRSFLSKIAEYNIVSVFSHAFADTMNNEPVLYMQDSAINLSELQLLNNPATQLVILSACQTNVGRNETGEGIFSLARGFASVGIPAVAATLWKADENAIYLISDKFNEYLAKGVRKDEALQMSKLNFININDNEKLLPYYWANMVLIGKSDPVNLLPASSSNLLWGIIGGSIVVALIFIIKHYLNAKLKKS